MRHVLNRCKPFDKHRRY